jgi:hypothetical protein
MKKLIMATFLLILIPNTLKSQDRDIKFQIEELTKFSKDKNIDFFKLYKEDGNCVIVYKNRIVLNLALNKKENREVANHEMHFTFFIPEYLDKMRKESDYISLLDLIENQIKSKSFALKDFLIDSIENAKKAKNENVEIQDSTLKIFSYVKNQDSEVVFTINKLKNGSNIQIDFFINL